MTAVHLWLWWVRAMHARSGGRWNEKNCTFQEELKPAKAVHEARQRHATHATVQLESQRKTNTNQSKLSHKGREGAAERPRECQGQSAATVQGYWPPFGAAASFPQSTAVVAVQTRRQCCFRLLLMSPPAE